MFISKYSLNPNASVRCCKQSFFFCNRVSQAIFSNAYLMANKTPLPAFMHHISNL